MNYYEKMIMLLLEKGIVSLWQDNPGREWLLQSKHVLNFGSNRDYGFLNFLVHAMGVEF